MSYYPPVSFHFRVEFGLQGVSATGPDADFQEVSGLSSSMGSDSYAEGGENRFSHKLPTRAEFGNLTLKRGMLLDSAVIDWVRDGIENYVIRPIDLSVVLLNPKSEIVARWEFVKAWPLKWDVSGFNSTDNNVVTETLELAYQYFRRVI